MSAGGNAQLHVADFSVYERPTFMEYLRCGWTISMVAAIDYTASNGDKNNPDSLHYQDIEKDNQYEQAIKNVGYVIEPYDHDKMFPVFGFGGIPNHCGIR